MKEVTLVKLNKEQIMVEDMRGYFQLQYNEPQPQTIAGSSECVIGHFVDLDNCKIERIVIQGVENYIAVTTKVWEYLYLISNPVTAESQEKKINIQRNKIMEKRHAITHLKHRINIIENCGIITRLKFLFVGIKV